MSQDDRALKLCEVLIKRRQEAPTPPEVIAEVRRWQAERERVWRERLRTKESDSH